MWQMIFAGVQAVAAVVTAFVAWWGVEWARRTFTQQAQHAEARETPHAAFMLAFYVLQPNDLPSGPFAPDEDYDRLKHWQRAFQGGEHASAGPLSPQLVTCWMTSLGPGTVVSATVPYTVDVFDHKPAGDVAPTISYSGAFRFVFAQPISVSKALNAITTTHYPYFRVKLGTPEVRGVRGPAPAQDPEPHLSRTKMDFENSDWWAFVQWRNQEDARAAQAAPRLPTLEELTAPWSQADAGDAPPGAA